MLKRTLLTRKKWLLAILACSVAAVALGIVWSRSNRRSNVILVTFDTTRADRIGVYGYPQGLTEVLDQLAHEGVVFERAYAPAPLTLPSHATMLTGLYPPEHGLRVNGSGSLGRTAPLLPAILKENGYDTGAFIAAFVLNSKFGLNRGFDLYDDDLSDAAPQGEHSFDRRRTGERVVDSALTWLQERTSRPFFCWIHLYDAHHPYDAREKLFGEQFAKQPYDAGIAVEVQQLARVLKLLKERQLEDSTVVIVAGDHGEGLGQHGEEEHGNLVYETTLRVPLVVVAPGQTQPGHRVAEPVSLVDLTPTILDVLGLPALKATRGRSLKPALKGDRLEPRPCYAETEAPYLDNRWCPMHAVISGRWKYVSTTRGELFDLERDPDETNNLWESEPHRRQEMHGLLQELEGEFVPVGAGNVQLSDKDRRILESLGYAAGKTDGSTKAAISEALPDMKEMLPFQTRVEKVRELVEAGQLAEAATMAREIVAATSPRYPMAELVLGDVLRQQELLDEAASVYQAVVERHPDFVRGHARLGDLHSARGQWQQAEKEYRAVIALEPEASHTHLNLARVMSRLGQHGDAMEEYQEAIRSDPGFVTAHSELGLLYAKSHRFEDAIDCFEQALKYDPELTVAHMNLCGVLLQLKRVDEATAHAQKAAEIEPDWFEARFTLGTLLMQQGQYQKALAELREAQRLSPEDPRPARKIEEAEAKLGRDQSS